MGISHAVLGVAEGADHDEIRAAYIKKVLQCHPSMGVDDYSFKMVANAYKALTGPAPGTKEIEAARVSTEMQKASEWCASAESSGAAAARFGGVEIERHGASAKIVGRMRGGKFRFDGRITIHGDVSSTPWGGDVTDRVYEVQARLFHSKIFYDFILYLI